LPPLPEPLLLRLRLELWPEPLRLPPLLDESDAFAIAAARRGSCSCPSSV